MITRTATGAQRNARQPHRYPPAPVTGLRQNHIERILAGWVGELSVPFYHFERSVARALLRPLAARADRLGVHTISFYWWMCTLAAVSRAQ